MSMEIGETRIAGAPLKIGHILRDVERPLLMEHSVKAIGPELRAGRFLVSFPRAALGPGPSPHLKRICGEMFIPAKALAVIDLAQKRAVAVHIGHEPERGGDVFKCYLEFRPDNTPIPGLVFLATKWRGARWVATRYWYRGGLTDAGRLALLKRHVPAGPSLDLMTYFSALPECRDRLLEIDEPGSPRRSVDLNLSEAGLALNDCPRRLAAFLGGTEAAQAYVARHRGEGIGHLAAGIARTGESFATLYHGACRIEGELEP